MQIAVRYFADSISFTIPSVRFGSMSLVQANHVGNNGTVGAF